MNFRLNKILITTALFLLQYLVSFSQTPNNFFIGKEEFLGIDIYSIIQYNELLYVSTNNGLYKQQNNTFFKLPFKQKRAQSLFDLKKDNNNNLYCKSLSGTIYKLNNDSLEVFYELDKKYYTSNFYFFFDKLNRLIITGDEVIRITKDKIENLTDELLNSNHRNRYTYFSHKLQNSNIFISAGVDSSFAYTYDNNKLLKYPYGKNKLKGGDMYLWHADSSIFLFDYGGNVFSETKSKLNIEISDKPRFFDVGNNILLILGEKYGIQVVTVKKDTLIQLRSIFNNQYISYVYKDKKNVLYLGTFGDGIIVVPNYLQNCYTINQNITGITKSIHEKPVISTWDGTIYSIKSNDLEVLSEENNKIDNIFNTPVPIGNTFQKHNGLIYTNTSLSGLIGSIKDVNIVNDSLVFIADQVSISALTKNNNFNHTHKNFFIVEKNIWRCNVPQRYYSVAFNSANKEILASNGKEILNLNTKKYFKINNKNLKANKLRFYHDTLIVANTDSGIFFIKDKHVLKRLNYSNGLLSNHVLDFNFFFNYLVILSKKGLQLYHIPSKEIYNVNYTHGIGKDPIIDFVCIDSSIWVTSKKSFYEIKLSSIAAKQEAINFSIDSIFVNDNSESINKYHYNHTQNKFNFKLGFNDFIKMKNAYFVYKLEGFDKDYIKQETSIFNINYQFLPPGDYCFKVAIEYNNLRTDTKTYSFTISPPLYQRWWFFFLILLLIIGIIVFLAFLRISFIQKKNKERLEKEILSKNLLDSELKALRSQMNPHFIFNSLNSIQNLVLKQDIDKSYDFIAMFAELVRSTLNYSEKEFISINDELRFLKVYLDLEKLRFKNDFVYSIENNCSTSTQIPSILVQPFVENALKHGLLHKKGIKKLNISFEMKEVVVCKITDNGVGRAESEKIKLRKGKEHISFSMNAIDKRLKILSEQYKGNFYYSIRDLENNGISCGTEITLFMPFRKTIG